MELAEAVRHRRMVRRFSGDPVPLPTLAALVEAACRAPAAGNTDGWAAVVLSGPAQTAVFWSATTDEAWRAHSRRWPGLSRAAAVVVLVCRPDAYVARYAEDDKAGSGLGASAEAWPVPYWFVDVGMAAMALLLAVTDAGLGACFLGNFRGEAALLDALGVPAGWRYAGAVALGPVGGDDPPSRSARRGRRRPERVVHWGRWAAVRAPADPDPVAPAGRSAPSTPGGSGPPP